MKSFKKLLRLIMLVLFIALATFGISIAGGVPVPPSNRKENIVEIKIELLEADENKTESVMWEARQ